MQGMGHAQAGLTPPPDLETAHGLAVARLRSLARDLDEAERDALTAELASRGVAKAEVLMDLPAGDNMNFDLGPEVVNAHPDDPDVLALQVMMSGWGQGAIEPERLEAAADRFDADRPTLALLARLSLFGRLQAESADHERLEPIWAAVRDRLDAMDEAPDMVVMMLAQQLAGIGGQQNVTGALDDGQRAHLIGRLRAWYGGVDATNQMKPMLLMMISGVLIEAEDWAGLGRLLTDETLGATGNAASNPMMQQMRMMQGQGSAVASLTFPPTGLTTVPPEVLALLQGENMFGPNMNLDHAALLEALPEGAPPILRALVAGTADDAEAFEAALQPVLAGEEPSLDALLLSAAWSQHGGDPVAALDPLVKATYLPLNRADRTRLDGAIVAAALDAPGDLDEAQTEAARRSALRLRRSAVTAEDQSAVIDALASLGLGEEAERMEDRIANAPAAPISAGAFSHGGGTPAGPPDRVSDLLDEGRRDDAVRLALREVRNLVTNLNSGNRWILQHGDGPELLKLLQRRGLTEEVIAAADPGPDARGRRRVEFAGLLEVLDETERATDLYRAAVEERPDATSVARLATAEFRAGDAEAAAETLARCPERERLQLGQLLMQEMNNNMGHQGDPALLRTAADATARWMEAAEEPKKLVALWISSLFHGLSQPIWRQQADNGPALYDREAWARVTGRSDETAEDVFEGRVAAHDRLARAALRTPAHAPDAAARLALTAELSGEPIDPLIDEIEAALLADPRATTAMMQQGMIHWSSNDSDTARLVPAEERFARWSAEHGAADRVASAAETLRSQRRRAEAERLEALHAVFAADADGFLSAAAALAEAPPPSANPWASPNPLVPAVDAWAALPADAAPDLAPLLFEQLAKRSRSGVGVGAATDVEVFFAYAEALAEKENRAAAGDLLERFATEFLAPPAERVAYIDEHMNPGGGWSQGSPTERLQAFQQALAPRFESETLGFAALEQTRYFSMSTAARNWGTNLEQARRQFFSGLGERVQAAQDAGAALIAAFEGSPPLADGNAFRSFASGGGGQSGSLHDDLREAAAESRQSTQEPFFDSFEALAAWLADQPDTLGVVLTRAALTDAPLADTLAALQPYRDAIASMDPLQQAEVAGALAGLSGQLPEDLPAESLALAETLGAVRGDASLRRAQTILDLRSFGQHSNEAWEYGQQLPAILIGLAGAGEMEKALDLLVHWDGLMQRSRNNYGNGVDQVVGNLANNDWEDDMKDHAAAVRLVLAALADERLPLTFNNQTRYGLQDRLSQLGREVRESTQPRPGDAAIFRAVVDRLARDLGDANARPLLHGLAGRRAFNLSPKEIEELLGDPLAADATGDSLAAVATAGLHLYRGAQNDEADAGSPGSPGAAALIALIEDETFPAPARVGIAGGLFGENSASRTPDAIAAAATLLVETLAIRDATLDSGAVDELIATYAGQETRGETGPDARTLVTAWIDAVARPQRNRGNDDGLAVSLPPKTDLADRRRGFEPKAALLSLDLALAEGLNEEADRLLAADRGNLSTCPAAWLSLLRHGRADKAAELIRDRHADARPTAPRGFGFTDADAERLPELLAFFESEEDAGLRLFAEAALASLPTAGKDDGAGNRPHLAGVAERFDGELFASTTLRDVTLLMLAQTDDTAAKLAEALAEATDRFSLADAVSNEEDEGFLARELKLASLIGPLRDGDTAALRTQSDALHEDPGGMNNLQYLYARQLHELVELTTRVLLSGGDLTPAKLTAARPAFEALCTPVAFQYHTGNEAERLALLFVLHGLDPDSGVAGFQAWLDETEEASRNRREPRFMDIRSAMARLIPHDGTPLDDRARVITEALKHDVKKDDSNLFHYFIEFDKILTPDELAERGEALAEPAGDLGTISVVTALATRDHPGAAEAADRGVEKLSGPDTEPGHRMMLIDRLAEHGLLDHARRLAEGWAPDDEKIQKRLDSFRAEHDQEAAPVAAETA